MHQTVLVHLSLDAPQILTSAAEITALASTTASSVTDTISVRIDQMNTQFITVPLAP